MSQKCLQNKYYSNFLLLSVILSLLLVGGCAVEAAKKELAVSGKTENNPSNSIVQTVKSKAPAATSNILIQPDSPADTVRVFYKNLGQRKFREAMFLTNLRPAIEGLTDDELKDLQVDFEPLAAQVPTQIEINGEIISKDRATVTAKLPDNETGEMKLQELKLRQENGVWTILTVDEAAEAVIKKEGKNYFFALRIETHHSEAKAMLDRIAKAQIVYSAQNNGLYGDLPVLAEKKLLTEDALTPQTTGYTYQIELSADKKKYSATATPAVYGKTGRLTFRFESSGSKAMAIKSQDLGKQAPKM